MQLAKSEFMTPRQALAANGKSFDWARRFLGKRMGGDAATLYRFCRVLDDMADGDISDGPRRLLTIRDDLAGCRRASDPLLADFQPFIQQRNMPVPVIIALIDGLLQDQKLVRIADERALRRYAYRVAGTVGLLMCHVLDCDDDVARAHAIEVARSIGTAQRQLLLLADEYYQSGAIGLSYLPWRAHIAIAVAATVYRRIGVQIAATGYGWHQGRQVTSQVTKITCSLQACGSIWRRFWPRTLHSKHLHDGLEGLPYVR
jgi:phytoene synthase